MAEDRPLNFIGTVMGTRWLSVNDARRRIPAAAAIVMGVTALTVG